MHGRLKVKDSAEKAAEKAREREKKRRKYLAGTNILFEKRSSCTKDSECLHVSALLLQANPDALTLWNCRRETLLALRDDYQAKENEQAKEDVTTDDTIKAADPKVSVNNDDKSAPAATEAAHTVEAPGVEAPTVEAPTATAAPTVEAPTATAAPTVEAPTVEAPTATAAPTVQAPAVEAPTATAAPTVQAPTLAEPNAAAPLVTSSAPAVPPPSLSSSGMKYPPLPGTWQGLLDDELHVVSACLQHNPKSYGAWHHRSWVMEQVCDGAAQEVQQKAWDEELRLCNLFLKKDERNFHCWDYRRVVVRRGGVAATRELSYAVALIDNNFSNFSAWHYMSKLLPQLHPPTEGSPHPVGDSVFHKELNRVVEAVFTDPGDQSPWFFLRWLLQRQPLKPRPVFAGVCRLSPQQLLLVVSFSAAAPSTALPIVPTPTRWTSPTQQLRSKVWSTILTDYEPQSVTLEFPEGPATDLSCSRAGVGGCSAAWTCPAGAPSLPPASAAVLEKLLDECSVLDSVDPDNKWVLLTLVEVLWALGQPGHRSRAHTILRKLEELDPLRAGYYADMKSKLLMENLAREYRIALQNMDDFDGSAFIGSHQELTRVGSLEVLACCSCVDLSNNKLVSVAPLSQLLLCTDLCLDGNTGLTSLTALTKLLRLAKLSLNNCEIANTELLSPLTTIPNLKHLALKDNFVEEADKQHIRKLFEHVKCVEF